MSFPAYPNYRETGIEWLGILPSHWAISRIKFDSLVKARVGWHGLKSDEFTDEGPYLVTGSDFKGKTIDWRNCYHCTEERYDQDQNIQLSEGDLLITKDGTIGKLMLVTDLPGPATLNSGIFVVRPETSSYITAFYYWMLQSSVFYDFIAVRQTGSTISHLYQETFGNLPYGLPPLQEQTQIARFLDHETAKIDALIREQKRLIELLQEKRQAVISHAVTKGLDPNVPMKDSGVEWLGEVPAHWIVARIKNFARIESGHTPDKKKEEYWVDCDIPWVSLNDSKQLKKADYIADTSTKVNDLGIANSSARLLPKEAVVFTRDASIGLSAITTKPMAVSQHLIAWLCAGEKLVPEYLLLIFYAMESEFERYTFGATIKTIGMDDVRSLTAAFPPMEEQKQLVAWAFRKKETLRAGLDAAEKTILLLEEHRSALISAAVTGKIDVRNWQPPTDESAFDEEVHTVGMEATA